MSNPTTGELKIMVDNLDKKLDEMILDIKDIAKNTENTAYTVIKHDTWIKNFWWFLGFLGTIVMIAVPVLRYIELSDLKNSQNETAGIVVSTLEEKYNLKIEK